MKKFDELHFMFTTSQLFLKTNNIFNQDTVS